MMNEYGYKTGRCDECQVIIGPEDQFNPPLCSDCAQEQERRWAALDASVSCSHSIPGTCDYC